MKQENKIFLNVNTDAVLIYETLVDKLNVFPKLIIKRRKALNRVAVLCSRKNFGYLSLVDDNNKILSEGFIVVFSLQNMINDKRIYKVTEVITGHYSHYVRVKSIKDIDDVLLEWLKLSYEEAK